jgi:amino acid transporter
MGNFRGWDNASTFAGEVDRPQRTYPLAILGTVALVTLTYLIPVAAAQHAGLDASAWKTGSWVTAGAAVGGPWLGRALVAGGMISAIGSFNSLLLSYSRIPVVLAIDGFLPASFNARLRGSGAPWLSILVCSIAYASCLGLGFSRLVQLDIILYGLSLALEFAALVALRKSEPELPRPFRVPGGLPGALAVGIAPMGLLLLSLLTALGEEGSATAMICALFLVWAGPAAWWLAERKRVRRTARAG